MFPFGDILELRQHKVRVRLRTVTYRHRASDSFNLVTVVDATNEQKHVLGDEDRVRYSRQFGAEASHQERLK